VGVKAKNGDILRLVFAQGSEKLEAPVLKGPLTLRKKEIGSSIVFFRRWWPANEAGDLSLPMTPSLFDQPGQLIVTLYSKESIVWSEVIAWPRGGS
jgi:hypothetical protein